MGARPSSSRSSPLHDPAYAQFRVLLRKWRQDAGLSQRDLAARLNKAHTFVEKSEQGERRIDPVELIRWTQACGVSAEAAIRQVREAVG